MAHGLDRHPATGAAGADWRLHLGFSSFAVALRRARDSRLACRPAYDHDPDLDAISISAALGYGCSLFRAAAAGDDGADRSAKKNPRAQRLQHRRWQRHAKTVASTRLGQGSRADLRARHSLAFGFPALLDPAQGRAFKGLGNAFNLGQFYAAEFLIRIFPVRRYSAGDLQYF